MSEVQKALNSAKLGLLIKGSKFISTLAFSMQHVIDDSVQTAAVDGKCVYYNTNFFMSLSKKERITLIAHEAWHVALLHLTRGVGKDPEIYNDAGDYVINQLLVDAGMPLPKGGLLNSKFKGWSTNQVYDELIQNPNKYPKSGTGSPGDFGKDIRQPTQKEIEEIEMKVKGNLIKAKTASKMAGERTQGNIPNEALVIIDDLINPKLDWTSLLERFLTEKVKDDFTWCKPNKYFQPDYIIPSQESETLGHIAIAIDTSGSLSKEELTEILSEITYIHETFKPSKLTILDCDTKIHNVHEVINTDSIADLKFSGRGGTSFKPVFDYFEKQPPQALIYFTDLYATQITEEPTYPVMWICNSQHEPSPIGETIYL